MGAAATAGAGVALDPAAADRAAALSPGLEVGGDPFAALRARWVDYLTGGAGVDLANPDVARLVDDLSARAADALATALPLAPSGDLWADLPMRGPKEGNISGSYQRVLLVATAWATHGTAQAGDPAVAATLVAWYRHLSSYWYTLTIPKAGNWWFWEIGIPRTLGDLTAIIDGQLEQADRDAAMTAVRRFTPNPNWRGTGTSLAETGGNRADKALACLLRGIASRSEADMVLARDALSDVVRGGANSLFRHVTSGNGFYADGSYIDHSYLPYVGTYGNVALAGVARSLMLLAGSPWDVTDPAVSVILDAPDQAFAPFIWNGRMLETVRGRAVSRERERDFHDGFTTANSLLLLAAGLGEPHRTAYRSLAKGWLERCTVPHASTAGIGDASRALALLADDAVEAAPEPTGHRHFGAQERMVHRGAGWAFTVATSSKRIGRYEWGNNENNLGWHQGDGAAYLYVEGDQGQFSDDYWPTVDPYRLPGTTASLTPRSSGASGAGTGIPRASNAWAGGVSLAGRWGTAGMDLVNSLGDVSAKKSWFVLDDLIIALGSDVQAWSDAETTVENRSFATDAEVRLTLDGAPVSGPVTAEAPKWAHLAGVAGYVFVGAQRVHAQVAERSGSWYDLNSGADTAGSSDRRTRRYATLSALHPAGTAGGAYGYVILPGASAAQTAEAAAGLELEVLRQDAAAHIVRLTRGGVRFILAHLFQPVGEGVVQADGPCAVIATRHGNEAQLAVSSPTRAIERAAITVDFGRPLRTVVSADERLAVAGGKVVAIEAALSNGGGRSFEATLAG
jgi:hyaluronate lyase